MARDIAKDEKIPSHFLAKILQSLARKGLLRSTKGPSGGFCLELPAPSLNLLTIVHAVDGVQAYERCIAGLPACTDADPCPMHKDWVRLRSRIVNYLEQRTIGDLARAASRVRKGRRALPSQPPEARV